MANELTRFGIKEVADVRFYEIVDGADASAEVAYEKIKKWYS